jgi:hypothetical protein
VSGIDSVVRHHFESLISHPLWKILCGHITPSHVWARFAQPWEQTSKMTFGFGTLWSHNSRWNTCNFSNFYGNDTTRKLCRWNGGEWRTLSLEVIRFQPTSSVFIRRNVFLHPLFRLSGLHPGLVARLLGSVQGLVAIVGLRLSPSGTGACACR